MKEHTNHPINKLARVARALENILGSIDTELLENKERKILLNTAKRKTTSCIRQLDKTSRCIEDTAEAYLALDKWDSKHHCVVSTPDVPNNIAAEPEESEEARQARWSETLAFLFSDPDLQVPDQD